MRSAMLFGMCANDIGYLLLVRAGGSKNGFSKRLAPLHPPYLGASYVEADRSGGTSSCKILSFCFLVISVTDPSSSGDLVHVVINFPSLVSPRLLRTYVLISVLVPTLNCGGKADNGSSEDSGGSGNSTHQGGTTSGATIDTLPNIGSATNAGATTARSSAGGVGAQTQVVGGSTGGTTCAEFEEPVCVSLCDGQWRADALPVCQNGNWSCPSPTLDINDCPADSCAKSYQRCCHPISGELSVAPCDLNGYRGSCPSPTRPTKYECIPDDLNITQCGRLEGKPCPVTGQRCEQSGTHCSCGEETSADGVTALVWQCLVDLI